MSTTITPLAPQGAVPAIGIPNSQDYPRLVFTAPYFETVPLAELIEPSVIEAVEAALPSLVPPYVDAAAIAAVQQNAVLLTGSTMSGPLFLNPVIPTQPAQAASMAYVDAMIATAGIPEVPPVPAGQVWARETGQWVPISQTEGTFLPLSGGTMTGNISMSGNTINNLASVPSLPNGAAPAQWVLNQIASVSLYQGTWNADTNVPDLTQLMYRVNGYTWIAITTSVSGVVVGQAIPGLQGVTIYNGDTIIYSTVQGQFTSIHAGGLTLPEADARYVQLAGSQMSGALLLNANATDPLQAVTLQQMQAAVATAGIGEAPNTGQLYGRNGLTTSWAPVLPLAGGILTGALTLSGNATSALQAVPFQQLNSAISGAVAGYVPLTGGTMSGLLTLSGNASNPLNPTTLQQVSGMLGGYLPLSGGTLTGLLYSNAGVTFSSGLSVGAASGQTVALNVQGAITSTTTSTLTGLVVNTEAGNTIALQVNGDINASGVLTNTGTTTLDGATINTASGQTVALNVQGAITATGSSTLTGLAVTTPSGETVALSVTGNLASTGTGTFGGVVANALTVNGAATMTGQVTCANCMPQGGNDTGSVGAAGQAWFQMASYAFNNESDPRLKKDIAVAPAGALAKVLAIPIKNYRWLAEAETDPLHTGWDATDVQSSLGNAPAVHVGTDANQTLALNAMEMMAWLWQAVQELAAKVPA